MSETFAACVLEEIDGKVAAAIRQISDADLPAGDVTVRVAASSFNYKDGMILSGLGRLVRSYPHVPGIDFAGIVEDSAHPDFAPGDAVVLTGWRVGEVHWGGFAEKARVKGDWLVKKPEALTLSQAMAIGTAGFTAMLAVDALERHGLTPDKGEVLVTGAAGGVGSVAVAVLAQRGYRVVASTGRTVAHDYLKDLGAHTIIDRAELAGGAARPLNKERWAAAVDTVGGATLSALLTFLQYDGAVAACGLAGGNEIHATVLPFLLRGVCLLGIDSVMCPLPRRTAIWQRLARDMPPAVLEKITSHARLEDLPRLAGQILAGQVRGRVVIDIT